MECNVADIKARYPNPVTASHADPDAKCYCVGGAFMLACNITVESGARRGFPITAELAEALKEANPLLPDRNALHFARRIVGNNDTDNYDAAWRHLEAALNFS